MTQNRGQKKVRAYRSHCLRYATELVAPMPLDAREKTRNVLNIARAFETYIESGEIPEDYRGYPWDRSGSTKKLNDE